MYQVLTPSRSSTLALRHLNYHVRHWGPEQSDLPTLVLLHGWMDVSASYQFTVDALRQPRRIIAPDWRGFGLTTGAPVDHYVFADYLADLDLLLDHYAPGEAIDLVGHSMGGNVAMMYGGVRPERVRKLVNLEGFGLPATRPAQAPTRYAQWIDEIKQLHLGTKELKTYDSADGVARRLMKTNPRLSEDKAQRLAQHWATPPTRSPARSCTARTRPWPSTNALPHPCWPSRPVATAWASGGTAGTPWRNTTSAWPMCAPAARPSCKTQATCCTTTSLSRWRS